MGLIKYNKNTKKKNVFNVSKFLEKQNKKESKKERLKEQYEEEVKTIFDIRNRNAKVLRELFYIFLVFVSILGLGIVGLALGSYIWSIKLSQYLYQKKHHTIPNPYAYKDNPNLVYNDNDQYCTTGYIRKNGVLGDMDVKTFITINDLQIDGRILNFSLSANFATYYTSTGQIQTIPSASFNNLNFQPIIFDQVVNVQGKDYFQVTEPALVSVESVTYFLYIARLSNILFVNHTGNAKLYYAYTFLITKERFPKDGRDIDIFYILYDNPECTYKMSGVYFL